MKLSKIICMFCLWCSVVSIMCSVASGLVFFCEVKWVITLFIQLFSTK